MKRNLLKATLFSIFAATAIGISAPVFADTSPEDAARFVKICDSNKDGMVSKAEVMKRAEAEFAKMDKAKKGMVDSKQFVQFLLDLQKSDGGTSGYDSTTRPQASKADMMKKIETAFDNADTAKKGMLDRAQLQGFFAELMKSGA
jgi:Ca2+-binding EF-hand superfamily protein